MRIKALAISAAATAGVAGLAFGGTAVSTSFSSDAHGQVTMSAAKIALGADGTLNPTLTGLTPGGSEPFTFTMDTSNSTAPGALSLEIPNWNIVSNGTGGAPRASEITVSVTDAKYGFTWAKTLDTLIGKNTLLFGRVPAGINKDDVTVTVSLDKNAGNEWNGASVKVPFTLHLQDTGKS